MKMARRRSKWKLPENLTTWVSDVRAVTADSRVGEATNEVVSTKPLFVQLQTPRFFVVGDQATVGATIFNNSEENLKVNVSLDAEGVDLKSEAKQTIEVEGRQQAYVTWDVVVHNNAERVDMTATATSGNSPTPANPQLGTLSGQGIPVLRYTAVETVGTSGMIIIRGFGHRKYSTAHARSISRMRIFPSKLRLRLRPRLNQVSRTSKIIPTFAWSKRSRASCPTSSPPAH